MVLVSENLEGVILENILTIGILSAFETVPLASCLRCLLLHKVYLEHSQFCALVAAESRMFTHRVQ